MKVLWAACLLASAGGIGCANPPRFVKKTPGLRLLYRPWSMPFLEHPQFSFSIKRDWKGPEGILGGVRYSHPKGDAWITVQFLTPGTDGYREPGRYRQFMREQGAVEDAHVIEPLEISSRSASVVRFTTYDYAPDFLLGEKVELLFTELVMIPDPHGIYVLRYEAPKNIFFKRRRAFAALIPTLTFTVPKEDTSKDPLPFLRRLGR